MAALKTAAVLPAYLQPLIESRLPDWAEPHWWNTPQELEALAPLAEIGWFDVHVKAPALRAIASANRLRWLSSAYAGVDWMPLDDLHRRGVQLTGGSGLTAGAVAEFAVMGMLAIAKDYRAVVRAQDAHHWLAQPPGTRELAGSRALVLGYGKIGQAIGRMLAGFGVEAVPVRSQSSAGALGPDEWRGQIGTFDWIVLALPGTADTCGIIGAAELAAMKPDAVLINFARADCVDQNALIAALKDRQIAAAMLDLTDPEPLPPDHPLWQVENAHITMHLSGMPTPASRQRAAERFLLNCGRFAAGQPLEAQVDLLRGY